MKHYAITTMLGLAFAAAGVVVVSMTCPCTTKMLIGLALESIGILIMTPWLVFGRAIKRFANARVFKIRCPDCDGTGICQEKPWPPGRPHSCCGDCARVLIPRAMAPEGFKGCEYENGAKLLVGSGVLYVGFVDYVRAIWRWGRRAFPPKKIMNPHLDPSRAKKSAAVRTH